VALPLHALKAIAPHLKGAEVLSLGYPDLITTPKEIERVFGVKPTKVTNANEWHGVEERLPETVQFFELMGAKLTVVDFTKDRGMERVANLNEPHDLGKYDLVIDPGTLEHCFNIGQAMLNAANAVKLDGRILHISPMNMVNHGFYNLCPTMFSDFYTQNGWTADMTVLPARGLKVSPTERFYPYMEYVIRCLAFRETDGQLKFPIQGKYLKRMQK
jgi:hypothetical protein